MDVLVLRLYEEEKLYEFARHSKIPIINGLTNESHPCQVLTDIFTFQELRGSISGKKVVWLGVANNVFQSFLHAAVALKFQLVFSGPLKFQPGEKMLEFINNESKDFVDFKLSINKDFKDDEDKKVSLIKNILKSISLIPDTLKQEIYIKKMTS